MDTMTAKQTQNGRGVGGPPNLAVFMKSASGMPLNEGLAWADAERRMIASNRSLGRALTVLETYMSLKKAFVCRSGDMAVYVMPGKTFRQAAERIASLGNVYFLVYEDPKTKDRYLFPVPEEHLDKRDALLVARHPDYSLGIERKDRVVLAARAGLLEKFPASDGWYPRDPEYDIPYEGKSIGARLDVGYLKRIGMRVGTVDTDYGRFPFADRRRILLDLPPSTPLGMVVEAP